MEPVTTKLVKRISKMKSDTTSKTGEQGFTLIELLIVCAMTGVIMGAVYSTYLSQQKTYVVQEQVAAMQQNIRSAMSFMEHEIRMAGCDPSGNAGAGIVTAGANTLQFTMDVTGSATNQYDADVLDADENITYTLAGGNLTRNGVVIAEDIDALDFAYLNSSRTETASLGLVRSIQVSILARAGRADRDYSNGVTYRNKQNRVIFGPANDNFRRRLLSLEIKSRNLGI
jgi:type IV pilus assembly protein PilW